MPKVTTLQTNFTAGEVSPRIYGRVDIARYQNGAQEITNGYPTVHGGVPRRGGFRYIASAKHSDKRSKLIPFVFSRTQAYMLEFGNNYMRVFKDRGQVLSSGSPYEISTPYTESMLSELDYCQSKDTMFIFHEAAPIYRLRRFDHAQWDASAAPFDVTPFDEIGTQPAAVLTLSSAAVSTGVTIVASAAAFLAADVGRTITSGPGIFTITTFTDTQHVIGDVSIAFTTASLASGAWTLNGSPRTNCTASAYTPEGKDITLTLTDDGFRSDDVDKFVKINSGLVQITAYTDAKHVDAVIVRELSSAVASPADAWSLNASIWNATNGYPRTGTIHQQRLVVAGAPGFPQRYEMSVTAESLNFTPGVDDTDGFSYDIESDESNQIMFMSSIRTLVAFTAGEEWTIDGGVEKPITPTNPQVRSRSNIGCGIVRPVRIRNELLFVQRAGISIHALSYNVANDDYLSPELTVLAEHMTQSGVLDMAFQQKPNSLLWCVLGNGDAATLTLDRDQDVAAWARQTTQGDFESFACIPSDDGDELWAVVRRDVNGLTQRYIEVYDSNLQTDSAITGSSAVATDTWSADHLEGLTVDVVAEGRYMGQFMVSGGNVTLPRAVTDVQIGLHYKTTIRPLTPEVASGTGTAQGNQMRTSGIVLRLLNTYGCQINGVEIFGIGTLDAAPDTFSGLKDISGYGWAMGESELLIEQDIPMPFHLQTIMRQLTVNQG